MSDRIDENPELFANTEMAFKTKSNSELKFSHFIFSLMQSDTLVKVLSNLALVGLKLRLPITYPVKKTIYKQFCGGENIEEAKKVLVKLGEANVKSILDYSVEAAQHEKDFERTKNELLDVISQAKTNRNMPIACLKVSGLGKFSLLEKMSKNENLTDKEKAEYAKIVGRLAAICEASVNSNIGLYIDAEESWIQPAIDAMAESMMANFNKEKVVVFTTLQMYRHDRLAYLENLLEKAEKGNFLLGIKFVRGAYIDKENERAEELNYPSPMHSSKQDTNDDYNKAIDFALKNIDKIAICAGTHNEKSCALLVHKMKILDMPNNHPHVYFSQLYGMSDTISFTLAAENYNVSKYLPYGPVKDALPYLIRRANENKSVNGQMGKELTLIKKELSRRKSAV